ncbi:hypothetical protein VNI00_015590 [Paramarasmius palmivorus]|uniref:Uncharacterized protein n=1 Tax=Paramarasmius palmivorus TaxID=297713 RepID=A0AAW0BMJ0_9AGAR
MSPPRVDAPFGLPRSPLSASGHNPQNWDNDPSYTNSPASRILPPTFGDRASENAPPAPSSFQFVPFIFSLKTEPTSPVLKTSKTWKRSQLRFGGYRNAEDLLLLAQTAVDVGVYTVKRGTKMTAIGRMGDALRAKGLDFSNSVFAKRLEDLLAWYKSSGQGPKHIRETIDMGEASVQDKISSVLGVLKYFSPCSSVAKVTLNYTDVQMEPLTNDEGSIGVDPHVLPHLALKTPPSSGSSRHIVPPMSLPPISFITTQPADASPITYSPSLARDQRIPSNGGILDANPFLLTPVSMSTIDPRQLHLKAPQDAFRAPLHPFNHPESSSVPRAISMDSISTTLPEMVPTELEIRSRSLLSFDIIPSPIPESLHFGDIPERQRSQSPGVAWVPMPSNKPPSSTSKSSSDTSYRFSSCKSSEEQWDLRRFLEDEQKERRERDEAILNGIRELSRRQVENMEKAEAFREEVTTILRSVKEAVG